MNGKIYQFEDYLLDVSEQRLQKNGEDISLPPKVFEVLTALVKRHGQLITYQELMEEVWQDTFVEETNLRYSIHTLRKTFPEQFIETVPKRGYRFKPEVKSWSTEEFIKKHTGNFKKDELLKSAEPPFALNKSIPKYAVVSVVALLMTGVGILGYYFWQNGKKNQPDKSVKTISILPFKIIGEESDQNRNLQKRLFESLVFDLSKIKGVKVNQPKEIENNLEKEANPLLIGKQFSADLVLDGGYRYEGEDSVKVDWRLLQISDGKDLLNESTSVKD
jgi:DNA-binding winged helix-turn-helix (wHTH) protein/TolB-like protein